MISKLQDADGVVYTDLDKLEHIMVDYFSQLFTGASTLVIDPGFEEVSPCVSNARYDYLCAPYTKMKVEKDLAQMNPHKAPGPDRLNAAFFQKCWDIIGDNVGAPVIAMLEGHAIPPKVNHTLVASILKKPSPTSMAEFRPISLCNVIYKLVTKVLSHRLKSWLPCIISDT